MQSPKRCAIPVAWVAFLHSGTPQREAAVNLHFCAGATDRQSEITIQASTFVYNLDLANNHQLIRNRAKASSKNDGASGHACPLAPLFIFSHSPFLPLFQPFLLAANCVTADLPTMERMSVTTSGVSFSN